MSSVEVKVGGKEEEDQRLRKESVQSDCLEGDMEKGWEGGSGGGSCGLYWKEVKILPWSDERMELKLMDHLR